MPRTGEWRVPPANLPMPCRFALKLENQRIFVAQNDLCDLFLHCIAQQQLLTTCCCSTCDCCNALYVVVSCMFAVCSVCLVCCCCKLLLLPSCLFVCLSVCLSVSCVCSLVVYRILTILRIVALAMHTARFNTNLSVLSMYTQTPPARKI